MLLNVIWKEQNSPTFGIEKKVWLSPTNLLATPWLNATTLFNIKKFRNVKWHKI